MTISERIMGLIRMNGTTQKAIAELLRVQPSTVNTWVKQNMESIPSTYIMPICRFFNITPEELLTGSPEAKINVSEDESKLLTLYRTADADTRIIIMAAAIKESRLAHGQN